MKKTLIFLIVFASFIFYKGQQNDLIINNFSNVFDYRGIVIATGLNSCYPQVSNTYYPSPTYNPLTVIANSSVNVGKYSSGNAIFNWDVQTSATNPINIRNYGHFSLQNTGVISLNTNWQHSKFDLKNTGTNISTVGGINLSDGTNVCYTWPSFYYNPSTGVDVEWFTIGNISYIQIY